MRFIADLHIHSYYSRATSKTLNLEHLHKWAQLKGLKIVATGDVSHPKWLEEMRQKLEPSQPGLYRLKSEYSHSFQEQVPNICRDEVHFILSGEISNIYKRDGQVRKVHNVVLLPSLEAAEKFQATLDRIGNIHSDGRPILGLDSRDLLEIVLDTDPDAHLIPAHIWTPWFSMLGSKSGFNSVEECYADLTPHIFALETGLSSDPPMNWRLSMLDRYVLVSNSDAHSPEKLAREANVFDTELSYTALFDALKHPQQDTFWGTVEFFPEEGKYHMDGHRKCNKMMRPAETLANNGLCPVCGKPAVLGVSYRVEELADRSEGFRPPLAKNYLSLVPLPEILAEVKATGPNAKAVQSLYHNLLRELGSELDILIHLPLGEIEKHAGSLVAEALRRVRNGQVHPDPGYDGEYGIIRIFGPDERNEITQQGTLFDIQIPVVAPKPILTIPQDQLKEKFRGQSASTAAVQESIAEYGLNEEQRRAVEHYGAPLIIQAGPGTGKTRTLTHRLAALVQKRNLSPDAILAVTFTNKAAAEMKSRLDDLLGPETAARMTIATFHAFGAQCLRIQPEFFGRTNAFAIVDPANDHIFRRALQNSTGERLSNSTFERIALLKGRGYRPDDLPKEVFENLPEAFLKNFYAYEQLLRDWNCVDYDDLIALPVRLYSKNAELRRALLRRFPVIAVDEFQDINKIQYEFFRLFAIAAQDACVIGDPDQAIYGFRGASQEFFLRFLQDFPHAKTIRLSRNYRSAQNILTASRQLLHSSQPHDEQTLWSGLAPDVKVRFRDCPTDRAEAEFIVHEIEKLIGGTSLFSIDSQRVMDTAVQSSLTFGDFCVLLRAKSLAPPLLEALSRSGIPHQTIADESFAQSDLFHFINASFQAAQKTPRQSHALLKLEAFYSIDREQGNGDSPSSPLINPLKSWEQLPENHPLRTDLSALQQAPHARWMEVVLQNAEKTESVKSMLTASIRKKLIELTRPFGDEVDRTLDVLSLQKEIDSWDQRADRVHVMTLHASKGLEFPVVFIMGCEDDIIPFRLYGQISDPDEERRLLFVGMTRAQRLLYLSHARSRLIQGQKKMHSPSRFLSAISEDLLQRDQPDKMGQRKSVRQLKLF